MRNVWTDAGDDPSWDVGDRNGITGYFFPMFDAVTTKELLQEAQTRGHLAGLYIGHGWLPSLTPAQYAAKANAEYNRLLVFGLRVQFNLEEHDGEFVAAVFEEWRKLQPRVGTSWSLEGMQGGWMSPSFVQRITASRIRVVPECFSGNMTRFESDAVLRNLLLSGFLPGQVSLFYDAAQLGMSWDGWAFTAGRLP